MAISLVAYHTDTVASALSKSINLDNLWKSPETGSLLGTNPLKEGDIIVAFQAIGTTATRTAAQSLISGFTTRTGVVYVNGPSNTDLVFQVFTKEIGSNLSIGTITLPAGSATTQTAAYTFLVYRGVDLANVRVQSGGGGTGKVVPNTFNMLNVVEGSLLIAFAAAGVTSPQNYSAVTAYNYKNIYNVFENAGSADVGSLVITFDGLSGTVSYPVLSNPRAVANAQTNGAVLVQLPPLPSKSIGNFFAFF